MTPTHVTYRGQRCLLLIVNRAKGDCMVRLPSGHDVWVGLGEVEE